MLLLIMREEGGEMIIWGKWEYWIDFWMIDVFVDEGDMFFIDDKMMLEKGRMVNLEMGLEIDYEEVWEDEMLIVILGVINGFSCVVLKMEDG